MNFQTVTVKLKFPNQQLVPWFKGEKQKQNCPMKSWLFKLNSEANIVRKVYAIRATFPEREDKIAETQIFEALRDNPC